MATFVLVAHKHSEGMGPSFSFPHFCHAHLASFDVDRRRAQAKIRKRNPTPTSTNLINGDQLRDDVLDVERQIDSAKAEEVSNDKKIDGEKLAAMIEKVHAFDKEQGSTNLDAKYVRTFSFVLLLGLRLIMLVLHCSLHYRN